MFDHLSLTVSDFEASLKFYEAALGPLRYHSVQFAADGERSAGFGVGNALHFWISEGSRISRNANLAFAADDHKSVQCFYQMAIAAGGEDNGAPGFRPRYHVSYYAAFVRDPDGNNIEVVCHFPGKIEDQFATG